MKKISLIILLIVSSIVNAQNHSKTIDVNLFTGFSTISADVPTSFGGVFGLGFNRQFHNNLSLQLQGSIGQLNGGSELNSNSSYSFTNKNKSIGTSIGYNFYFLSNRNMRLGLAIGPSIIWSNVKGNFGDSAEARQYYQGWGDSYFKPVYKNGVFTDAEATYRGRNLTLSPSISLGYRITERLDIGLSTQIFLTKSDALDAFSLPIWRNRYNDNFIFHEYYIKYLLRKTD